jgi:hypothetical protein
MTQRYRQHLLCGCHFQIDRQPRPGHDRIQIAVSDMPPVFTQVDCDTIAARGFNDLKRAHRIGMIAATRITDGGNVIDVDAQS